MADLTRAFRALRPTAEHAAEVVAPPYDVVDVGEARSIAEGRPHDFLHISRPEIDFPEGTDPHADAVYEHGATTLETMKRNGILVRESSPCYYVYQLSATDHEQTGIAMTASVEAYEANIIRRHELTRPDKERDRIRNIATLNAQTGPVLTVYRDNPALKALVDDIRQGEPLFSVVGPHAVTHTIWRVDDEDKIDALSRAFEKVGVLYIADGHHRSAAASKVAASRREKGSPSASAEYFLSVAFPHSAMRIFDYNRVVSDLNGLSDAAFLDAVANAFYVTPSDAPLKPGAPKHFGMYLDGQWFQLTLKRQAPITDPVADLDVSILQERLIGPVLGIEDPRTDSRIEFVGGVRGLEELEQRVDSGRSAVAFALFPTSMEQLMAVADAHRLMPPKSTWFEPKLADGLLSHVLD